MFLQCVAVPTRTLYVTAFTATWFLSDMALLQAKVKSVLSGDTLIITNQKGAERTLTLAYINAPRLKREGDEVRISMFRQAVSIF